MCTVTRKFLPNFSFYSADNISTQYCNWFMHWIARFFQYINRLIQLIILVTVLDKPIKTSFTQDILV